MRRTLRRALIGLSGTLPAALVVLLSNGGATAQVLEHVHADRWHADLLRGYRTDAIVVRLEPGSTIERDGRLAQMLDPYAASVRPAGVAAHSRLAQRFRVVELRDGTDADELLRVINSVDGLTASPVLVGAAMNGHDGQGSPGGPDPDLPVGRLPNDPLFDDQYALLNTGQDLDGSSGVPGADIGAGGAWSITTGSSEVVIAVLDAGVSADHPDLAAKLLPGYNVVGPDPFDTDDELSGHGTEVAGVAAAIADNARGIAGVAWRSPILPVVTANFLGFTSDVWLAEGLEWAVDAGADVAILSFGLSAPSDILAQAVRDATEAGVVVVASTGNTGTRGVLYPAAYPEVIAVGATDPRDALAAFSAFGPEVDLVAPGVDILTTTDSILSPGVLYSYESGTSLAAPLVAGVAALMRSVDPSLTPDQIRAVLHATATDLGEPGWDEAFGFGRLDAAAAVAFVRRELLCYADINGDGRIDTADFFAWVTAFSTGDLAADLNGDGVVDDSDFFAWVTGYTNQDACNRL